MKTADRIAALEAQIASLTAALAAQPVREPSPFSYRISAHTNAESGKVTTFFDFRNHSDKPLVIPAGCEVSFFANGKFEGGSYLKPKGEPKPMRKKGDATPPASEPTGPESIDF